MSTGERARAADEIARAIHRRLSEGTCLLNDSQIHEYCTEAITCEDILFAQNAAYDALDVLKRLGYDITKK